MGNPPWEDDPYPDDERPPPEPGPGVPSDMLPDEGGAGREVEEVATGVGAILARQFVGQTVGLFQQHDSPNRDGDHITADSTTDDITTEPDPAASGYERVVLKNNENPSFRLDDWVGTVDHMFIVDDEGRLLAAIPLRNGGENGVFVHDHLSELTPRIWDEQA